MKKAILILMTVAALGVSHVSAAAEVYAANLPEGNVGDGTVPNEEGDGPEGFQTFIHADSESGEEVIAASMPEGGVGSGSTPM